MSETTDGVLATVEALARETFDPLRARVEWHIARAEARGLPLPRMSAALERMTQSFEVGGEALLRAGEGMHAAIVATCRDLIRAQRGETASAAIATEFDFERENVRWLLHCATWVAQVAVALRCGALDPDTALEQARGSLDGALRGAPDRRRADA